MKTDAERKQAERDRKRAAGLMKIEFWLTPEQVQKVREFVAKLKG